MTFLAGMIFGVGACVALSFVVCLLLTSHDPLPPEPHQPKDDKR